MTTLPEPIEAFRQAITRQVPEAVVISVDRDPPDGKWWLDVVAGGETTLSWDVEDGFGIYADDALFGVPPVFSTPDAGEAATAIIEQARRVQGHFR